VGRARSERSGELVNAAYEILEEIQPCSVRAVCYRLFVAGVIESMATNETARVSRNLVWARENGVIPWEWIVDETRQAEKQATWANLKEFAEVAKRAYRRDRWDYQHVRVEVWSEKGTIRGTLGPVLKEYGVTLRVFHGFSSATSVNEIAEHSRDVSESSKRLVALYVGDYDPSGLCMSEKDLPERLERYGATVSINNGEFVQGTILKRIALLREDCYGLPSFDVDTKQGDSRYAWYRKHTGEDECWELDAMSPNDLRDRVELEIMNHIDREAWERTGLAEKAEQESLNKILGRWPGSISRQVEE